VRARAVSLCTILLIIPTLLHDSCFVLPSEIQATMTGRTWRHFSVFWPFMLAGAVGPRDAADPDAALLDGAPVAPVAAALHLRDAVRDGDRASRDGASEDGWPSGTFDEDAESDYSAGEAEGGGVTSSPPTTQQNPTMLPGPDVVNSEAYREVLKDMPIHAAVLDTFCRAARLGGALFGDNVADTTSLTGAQIAEMEKQAHELGIDCIQTLYGYINTSKLHRLVHHLGDELRARGNLWEGDTSENERLHASCKRMFKRSNKRGPGVTLQMMRCDETQSAVLQELQASDDNEASDADVTVTQAAAANPLRRTEDLTFTGRGTRVAVGDLHRAPALAKEGALLGLEDGEWVTIHNTARIMARFEWGAPTVLQHLRASRNFIGKPWFSFVRYEGTGDSVQWGRVLLVFRSVGRMRRSCVVVQRMRPVVGRPGCVLSRHGCQRLDWDFDSESDEYPALELVDATRILRAEDVQVD